MKKVDVDKLVRLYYDGYSDSEIAQILNRSPLTIKELRHKLGLLRRKPYRLFTFKDAKKLKQFLKKGYTYGEIADKLGFSKQTIIRWAKILGLKGKKGKRRNKKLWEKRRALLRHILEDKIMITYKEAQKLLKINQTTLVKLLREYPDDFTTYKFTYSSRRHNSMLFDGLLYIISGMYIALKNDERIVKFLANKIKSPTNGGQAKSIYSHLRNAVGDDIARKVMLEIYDYTPSYRKEFIKTRNTVVV